MDQRCHTFSFGHYHQVPGASQSSLSLQLVQPGILQFFGMVLLLLTQNADYNESKHCMYISLSKSVLQVAVAKDQICSTPVRIFINKRL